MEVRRLNKPLKILTFTMVFLGVLSVVLTGYLSAPQPLIVIVILLVGFLFWESKIHNRAYSVAWHMLTFLFLAWCCYDLFISPYPGEEATVRIPIAAMRLSIFLQVFKVYNAKSDRDYIHMFLLSFFQFVSCAGVSVEFYFLPLVLIYLVIAMWTLTLFHFRKQLRAPEAAGAAPAIISGRAGRGRLLTPGFFTGTFLASVLVAVMGGILFIFFPRSAASNNPLSFQAFFGRLGRRLSSGLSDLVDLNIAGIISRSPTRIMRVSFPYLQDPPHLVLWRAGTLYEYDGKRNRWIPPGWKPPSRQGEAGPSDVSPGFVLIQKSPGLFIAFSDFDKYSSIGDLRNDPQLVAQRYTLFHRYKRAPIFSAYSAPVAVIADVHFIASYVNESFSCQQYTRENFSYTVFSRAPLLTSRHRSLSGPMEAGDTLPGAAEGLYTQLPPELPRRFKKLAEEVTRNVSGDYEKARVIRNYLAMNCRYSLQLTQKPGRKGPLYDFLFADKPGHCEYFASAMVILLRELGIPSRLAHGYSTGRWNPERKEFEVRQLDAHAWAEAFISGRGWTPFDPTPAMPYDEIPETFFSALLTPVTGLFTFCENQWAEGVIGFSRARQRAAFRFVATSLKKISGGIEKCASSVGLALSQLWRKMSENILLALIVLAVAGLVFLAVAAVIVRLRRSGKIGLIYRKRGPPRRWRVRVKFYEKMLRLLMDRGVTKEPADTPLEFAHRVTSTNRLFSGVKTLTDLYYFVRFGNGKLTLDQSRSVRSILRQLSRPPSPGSRSS